MATKKSLNGEKIWHFDVTNPVKHSNGFTIYKVSCKVFTVTLPESITEINVWKRYNDFKRLHKSMLALHKALHRKEDFPEFAKPKYFGRFTESVIEERRKSALELLNFIGRQSHLHRTKTFQQFLEKNEYYINELNDYQNQTVNSKSNRKLIISTETSSFESDSELSIDLQTSDSNKSSELIPSIPTNDTQPVQNHKDDEPSNVALKEPNSSAEICNGVWSYPKAPDNISINSMEDEELEEFDGDVAAVLGTTLPDADISFFDPLQTSTTHNADKLQTSNSWLLSALSTCADIDSASSKNTPAPSKQQSNQETSAFGGDHSKILDTQPDEIPALTCNPLEPSKALAHAATAVESPRKTTHGKNSANVDISDFDPLGTGSSCNAKVRCGKGDFDVALSLSLGSDMNSAKRKMPSSLPSSNFLKLPSNLSQLQQQLSAASQSNDMSLKVGGKEDYIYVAANQICQAQECEASGNYEMSFAFYRNGVGILLQGVQGDSNKTRREAVRRKTAQYLMKAEDLYNRHLAKDVNDERRWALDSLSPPMELDPTLAFLRAPISELRNYKVLSTIDKVLLVLEKGSNETYIIKTIHKSGAERLNVKNILPSSCPYMVQLYKFYEGTDAIYLLLQYASGGKLWTYILSYLQLGSQENYLGFSGSGSAGGRNVYKGCKMHNSLTFHEQLPNYSYKEEPPAKQPDNPVMTESGVSDQLESSYKTSDCATSYAALFMNNNNNNADSAEVDTLKNSYTDLSALSNDAASISETGPESESPSHESSTTSTTFPSIPDEMSLKELDNSGDEKFQELLTSSRHHLAEFSITSNDSDRKSQRHSSGFSDINHIIMEDDAERDDTNNSDTDSLNDVFRESASELQISECSDTSCQDITKNSIQLLKSIDKVLENPTPHSLTTQLETPNNKSSVINTASDHSISVGRDELFSECNGSLDDVSDEEVSIYDLHKYSSSLPKMHSQSSSLNSRERTISAGEGESLSKSRLLSVVKSDLTENYSESQSINTLVSSVTKNSNPKTDCLEGNSGTKKALNSKDEKESTTAPLIAATSDFTNDCSCLSQKSTKHNTTSYTGIPRQSFMEPCRSASFECDLKSPSKSKVWKVFEEFDSSRNWSSEVVLPESCIKQWAAEVVIALSYLHDQGIICRDLKPSNVLLGEKGHVLISYFCQMNNVDQPLDDWAVENMYTAPEICSISGHTEVCDWWSFGALLFELLSGKRLSSCHPGGITSHTQLLIPSHISMEAQGLLEELLCYNPRERLGSGINGAEDIKAHPFFANIDWNAMESDYCLS
ncbi:ribosomal protein S6 kinase delta-1 isoform X1 [Octopus bimaculoides]|uniref:Protein kinase domain-containing protein n=2 Tax=Octopus bimaculoides TaxID=37653 RepID=A0A0L8I0K3_OCTBM|nr:ribosomal protein S6 kinase delta-1 isoform X1 [Octopus bimaculoides]|eukprot:XP_014767831.1 PREDICTED: ribosomal protein S6 kinase delta-1-like isoform X1 [Octopus bimaculoides]